MHKIIICSYDKKLLPMRHTDGAVCWDLRLAEDIELEANGFCVAKMGVKIYIPNGWHCKMYARGGLPVKKGLMLANSVGIFDSDYRGEYMFQLYNFTNKKVQTEKYTRIGQIEFCPHMFDGKFVVNNVPEIEFICDEDTYNNFEIEFSSDRGGGRFHSTGHI